MGREVKRVALDFEYPVNQMIWKGYHNPYHGLKCEVCDGSGLSPEAKKINDDWYGFKQPDNEWRYNLTQDEVDELFRRGRLNNLKKPDGSIPSAEEVNTYARKDRFFHDDLSQNICLEARLKRLGIPVYCRLCDGNGELWPDEKYAELAESFQRIDPPIGPGYQLWSTTTEGHPMSPVFATPEELAQWLTDTEATTFGNNTTTYEKWLAFIVKEGFALSLIYDSESGLRSGVDAA